jgi:chromosomal replication initiation ATPase DnaA
LILCGPTGVGKSWLACALDHKACRDNRSVLYQRVPKLFVDLALARGDGRYARIMRSLTAAQLLILDDWGLEPLDGGARRDLYEILEERYGRRPDLRRCHSRPPRPQRPSHRSRRRQPATNPTEISHEGLTSSSLLAKTPTTSRDAPSGRHHVGIPSDMISE